MNLLKRVEWGTRYSWAFLWLRRRFSRAPLATEAEYRWFGKPDISRKTALVACFGKDRVPSTGLVMARKFAHQGYSVNIIVAADCSFEASEDFPVMVRANAGYDFGSWAQAINVLDLQGCEMVALVNDSIVPGPRFGQLINQAEAHPAEVVGITESMETRLHVQSYFMLFKRGPDRNWWSKIRCYNRQGTIENYEIMNISDFDIKPLFRAGDRQNPTLVHWRKFSDYFVKRQLIRDNPMGDDLSDLPNYARQASIGPESDQHEPLQGRGA